METQESIVTWASETFGLVGSNFRAAARANEELAELVRKTAMQEPAEETYKEIMLEAADVVIVLCRLGELMGFQLHRGGDAPKKKTARALAVYANTRMSMLLGALELDEKHPGAAWCAASVYEAMKHLCDLYGHPVWDMVEAKMKVNRERKWAMDGSGHGYHVEEPTERTTRKGRPRRNPESAPV